MSKNLPNMLDGTLEKLRQMVDGNSIIGDAIHVGEDVTVIPISKISLGVAGGGADYVSKHPNNQENPFGGGVGAGVQVTPVAFLVVKGDSVRMLPVSTPATTTVDRLVEMIPETLDKITDFIDARTQKAE
jgi:sporulation protein YtfJ